MNRLLRRAPFTLPNVYRTACFGDGVTYGDGKGGGYGYVYDSQASANEADSRTHYPMPDGKFDGKLATPDDMLVVAKQIGEKA